jgi:carboxypeptidase C (cathepsin A)
MDKRFLLTVVVALSTAGTLSAQEQGRRRRAQPDAQPAPAQQPGSPPTTGPATAPSGGEKERDKDAKKTEGDKLSVTEHEVSVRGRPLKYKATAGTMQMKDESGKHKADLFFVAYEKQPAADNPAARPITYVFNGGPGAAAVWLHLGTAGPRRVRLNEEGDAPPPPYGLVDNEDTWLEASDLVFIDPVGTGYSRPAPGEKQDQFSGVEEDVRWVGEFIRLYTTRYQRWPSPKFLAGESYGTTRAAALSEYLLDECGINLNGIVLISTVLDFQTLSFGGGTDLPYLVYLPSYTAAAFHYKKLPSELQADLGKTLREVENWAMTQYVQILALGTAIDPARRAEAAKRIARYTGLSADAVDKADLRIDPELFRTLLLEDQRRLLGRFDTRMTGYDRQVLRREAEWDPSYSQYEGAYSGAINDYLRRQLKFESDVRYEVLTGRVHPWNFGQGGNGYTYVANRLRQAMIKNPFLKVMVAQGYHDLATPYFATRYTIDHMDLSPDLRKNITQTEYPGGHFWYHGLASLMTLTADVTACMAPQGGSLDRVAGGRDRD